MCALNRQCLHGVTLLMDPEVPCGVTLAFTERTGGFSKGEFASLNLGGRCGDNLQHVQKNRQLVLEALGAGEHFSRLLIPHQVHGSTVVCLSSDTSEAFEQAKTEAEAGADAIVCTVQNTPVLLAFADCVPVILVAPGGFAVAHSGWKGTIARISACTTEALCQATGAKPSEVKHILDRILAVLITRFLLSLFRCFRKSLVPMWWTVHLARGTSILDMLLELR